MNLLKDFILEAASYISTIANDQANRRTMDQHLGILNDILGTSQETIETVGPLLNSLDAHRCTELFPLVTNFDVAELILASSAEKYQCSDLRYFASDIAGAVTNLMEQGNPRPEFIKLCLRQLISFPWNVFSLRCLFGHRCYCLGLFHADMLDTLQVSFPEEMSKLVDHGLNCLLNSNEKLVHSEDAVFGLCQLKEFSPSFFEQLFGKGLGINCTFEMGNWLVGCLTLDRPDLALVVFEKGLRCPAYLKDGTDGYVLGSKLAQYMTRPRLTDRFVLLSSAVSLDMTSSLSQFPREIFTEHIASFLYQLVFNEALHIIMESQ